MASKKAHHASGMAAGLLAAAIVIKAGAGGPYFMLAMLTLIVGTLGGTAPDWMEVAWWRSKKKHRGTQRLWITHRTVTHWGLGWMALLYYSHANLGAVWWAAPVFGFACGGLMHLLTDWPNPLGVPWIFRRHSLGLWRSGRLESMVIVVTWALCALLGDALVFDSANTVKFIRFVPAFVADQYRALRL